MARYTYASSVRMVDLNPDILKLSGEQIGGIMTEQLGIAYSGTEKTFRGWEIGSHSLLLLGNHLVVSLLLRRPLG